MNLEGGTTNALPFPNGRVPKGINGSWHPGGKLLAFGIYGEGGEYGSWLVNVESGECRGLISGDAATPVWSPDGARLAIDIRHEFQPTELWVLDAPAWEDLGPSVTLRANTETGGTRPAANVFIRSDGAGRAREAA